MNRELFATRLRELREKAGLSQKELAARAGIGQRSVSNWEQGLNDPAWSHVLAMAKVLGVTCQEFIVEEAPQAKPPAKRPRGRPKKAE